MDCGLNATKLSRLNDFIAKTLYEIEFVKSNCWSKYKNSMDVKNGYTFT